MNILEEIKTTWGWTGIEAVKSVTENECGNIIVNKNSNQFWRLCPEEGHCNVIATSISEYNTLIQEQTCMHDWFMSSMVSCAEKAHGTLKPHHKYRRVIPGILGGDYNAKNIKTAPFDEFIRFSGDLAPPIKTYLMLLPLSGKPFNVI